MLHVIFVIPLHSLVFLVSFLHFLCLLILIFQKRYHRWIRALTRLIVIYLADFHCRICTMLKIMMILVIFRFVLIYFLMWRRWISVSCFFLLESCWFNLWFIWGSFVFSYYMLVFHDVYCWMLLLCSWKLLWRFLLVFMFHVSFLTISSLCLLRFFLIVLHNVVQIAIHIVQLYN